MSEEKAAGNRLVLRVMEMSILVESAIALSLPGLVNQRFAIERDGVLIEAVNKRAQVDIRTDPDNPDSPLMTVWNTSGAVKDGPWVAHIDKVIRGLHDEIEARRIAADAAAEAAAKAESDRQAAAAQAIIDKWAAKPLPK